VEIIKTPPKADPIPAFFKRSGRRLIVFIDEAHPVGANPPLINPAAVPEQRAASYRRKSDGEGRSDSTWHAGRKRKSGQDGARRSGRGTKKNSRQLSLAPVSP